MHIPVTDEQFYNALPPNGLQLADQTLQEDYERLRENDLPVKDTVSGLLHVQALQSQEVTS
jgi:hypothetical protein